jgi:hypothetical protein
MVCAWAAGRAGSARLERKRRQGGGREEEGVDVVDMQAVNEMNNRRRLVGASRRAADG